MLKIKWQLTDIKILNRTVSKIPKVSVKTDYNTYLRNSNCSSMVFFDSDEDEVFNIINNLKSNKSPGPIFERFIQLGKHVKIAINISITLTGAFG